MKAGCRDTRGLISRLGSSGVAADAFLESLRIDSFNRYRNRDGNRGIKHEEGRFVVGPISRPFPNNYLLNLLLTAARLARPGPRSRNAPGKGTLESGVATHAPEAMLTSKTPADVT